MAFTISLANQKGGVGKTTSAVNIAAAIGALDKRVLLVDLDPQGNSTSGVGVQRRTVKVSTYDVIIGNAKASEAVVNTGFRNLSLMPSQIALAGAEFELIELERRELLFRDALSEIEGDFDYIFIDCPPSLGILTINSLTAVDSVLIPIQCEFYALEGVSQLMSTIDIVRRNMNPDLKIEGVILSMFDGRTNLSIQVVEEVKKYFKEKVYTTVIPRNVRLAEAPSYGMPVIQYDPKSAGAQAYMEFADEFLANEEGR